MQNNSRLFQMNACFHSLRGVDACQLPLLFNCPFSYVPHPLCVQASESVMRYLEQQENWAEELRRGKMFGVLLVQAPDGEVGFLAAFSGLLQGTNDLPFFVPPVYDLLNPHLHFKQEEDEISALNRHISELEGAKELADLRERLILIKHEAETALADFKKRMSEDKTRREKLRKSLSDDGKSSDSLNAESAFAKAEYKRMKLVYSQKVDEVSALVAAREDEIARLKCQRRERSADLQRFLFENYILKNAFGEQRSVYDIFASEQKMPPAGTGECAAPKLLQFAYNENLKPLAMAEFWYGDSPKNEIRRHGEFYPSCHAKCEPILNFMLQGLPVEPNPLRSNADLRPEVIYDDPWLLVLNKPSGMLSAKGKGEHAVSVEQWARERYPEAKVAHRLDMSTSGILVVAKDENTYRHLQRQFAERTVKKRYVALLDRRPQLQQGAVALPLCPDINDRPRQMVHHEFGKEAVTLFEVKGDEDGRCRVSFVPHTGRTHQLRVHAAHPDGLDAPIAGDELYGRKAERLFLHAEYISFVHPHTLKQVEFLVPAPF